MIKQQKIIVALASTAILANAFDAATTLYLFSNYTGLAEMNPILNTFVTLLSPFGALALMNVVKLGFFAVLLYASFKLKPEVWFNRNAFHLLSYGFFTMFLAGSIYGTVNNLLVIGRLSA